MMKDFTKKISSILMLGAIAGFASGAVTERGSLILEKNKSLPENGKVTVAPAGVKAARFDALSKSNPAKVKRDASGMTWSVLIDEDFSKLTEGSIQEPNEERLCYYYGEPGVDIDPEYTQQPGWTGSNAFSAGGAIFMKEVNEITGAPLNTPLGDYSGNLTISFRYRILPGYEKHSQVIVDVLKGGIEHPQMADCDFNIYSCNTYPGDGWKMAEMTCRNLSSDNDGFIQFNCYGAVILDDIKVIACDDFIASPVLKPMTDFTPTSFTANWEPVRLAASYHVGLDKKVYTSDEETAIYNENFEDMTSVPEGWEINNFSPERIVDFGSENSKGLKMTNGDYIETPYNLSKYQWFKMFGRLVTPEGFDIYDISGYVNFSVRTDTGWKELGYGPAGWFYEPWSLDFGAELAPGFNNNFYGVKIEVRDLAEGTYLVLDDLEFQTGRPAKLEQVISLDDYEYIDSEFTSYTFTNLEPETEYYYSIYSFYQGIMSEPSSEHAFGVAAPELLNATDIRSNSYTANWNKAPKATGYIAQNYGVFTASEDIAQHTILEEDFSKITSDVTWGTSLSDAEYIGNYTASSLDEYTTLPGWTGRANTLFPGNLGVEDSMYDLFYIETPALSLGNADSFILGLMGQSMYDDNLVVWINNRDYKLPVQEGEFGGEFEIPEHGDNIKIMFYTANGAPFSLEYVSVSQDMKKGQKVYTFLGETAVDADTTSATFADLSEDYTEYAYTVKSVFEYEGATAYSDSSNMMFVDLKAGTSTNDISNIYDDNDEGIWFSIDGRRLSGPKAGICIVKYSDGTVKKILVKE